MGGPKKRPAARKDAESDAKRHCRTLERLELEKTGDLFDQSKFITFLGDKLGVDPAALSGKKILWASAYDGSNMPAQVLKVVKDVFKVKPVQVCGASAAEKSFGNARTISMYLSHTFMCIKPRCRDKPIGSVLWSTELLHRACVLCILPLTSVQWQVAVRFRPCFPK